MQKRGLLPFVLALVATVAVVATVRWVETNDGPPTTRTVAHLFDPREPGTVWVSVITTSDAPSTLQLRWGPFERVLEHPGLGPVTYWFPNLATDPAAPMPLEVELPRDGAVTFGQGPEPPAGAVSAAGGWLTTRDDTTTAP